MFNFKKKFVNKQLLMMLGLISSVSITLIPRGFPSTKESISKQSNDTDTVDTDTVELQLEYDDNGLPNIARDSNGNIAMRYFFDNEGNLTNMVFIGNDSKIKASTELRYNKKEYKTIEIHKDESGKILGTTEYTHDKIGRLIKETSIVSSSNTISILKKQLSQYQRNE